VDNEAGKMAVCWRNHIFMETPTACSGEFHSSSSFSRAVRMAGRSSEETAEYQIFWG
jgi:hypothetical protein